MSTEITKPQPTGIQKISGFLNSDAVKKKFSELLGKKSQGFVASVLSVCNSNELLKNATTESIYSAALTAATLDLPINANLGFAYIIPYKGRESTQAQFQIGYKGFIQLAQRSGQFKTIACTAIYEGQILSENPLTGYEFDFTIKSDVVIGYAAFIKLLNGFEKTIYWPKAKVEKHAKRFSQSYKGGFGIWKDDFDSMALKTVIKDILSKWSPLSIEMQRAIITDQAVLDENQEPTYTDNEVEVLDIDHELDRAEQLFKSCKTILELDEVFGKMDSPDLREDIISLYAEIKATLPAK